MGNDAATVTRPMLMPPGSERLGRHGGQLRGGQPGLRGRAHVAIAASLLVIAIVFGGGGSPAPLAELVVQIAALAALVLWLFLPRPDPGRRAERVWFWLPAALFAALPLVQLVPLPPALWHALPGRAIEVQALGLIGAADGWRPLSLDPYRTLAAALSLIPPAVMLFFVSRLDLQERTMLLGVVAALGCLAAFVGMVQLASGNGNWLRFYQNTSYGFATGFQANRNHQADLLLVAVMAFVAFVAAHRDRFQTAFSWLVVAAICVYLLVSIVLTGSRTGTGLVLPATLACVAMLRPRFTFRRRVLAGLAAGIVLLAAAGVALRDNAALQQTFSRFHATEDARLRDLWPDAQFALNVYWPVGSGMGTFVPVFTAAERLEVVDASTPNRAHNDYLEIAIEAGVAGVALLGLIAVAAAVRLVAIVRRSGWPVRRLHAIFVAGSALVFGLHSTVDYPMRIMSLTILAGMIVGLLSRAGAGRSGWTGGGDLDAY